MLLVLVHLRCVGAIFTGGRHHPRARSCAGLGHHCALAATVPNDPAFIDGAREALSGQQAQYKFGNKFCIRMQDMACMHSQSLRKTFSREAFLSQLKHVDSESGLGLERFRGVSSLKTSPSFACVEKRALLPEKTYAAARRARDSARSGGGSAKGRGY